MKRIENLHKLLFENMEVNVLIWPLQLSQYDMFHCSLHKRTDMDALFSQFRVPVAFLLPGSRASCVSCCCCSCCCCVPSVFNVRFPEADSRRQSVGVRRYRDCNILDMPYKTRQPPINIMRRHPSLFLL